MNTWIIRLLGMILPLLTPELKKLMCDFIVQFKEKAAQTKNPWDDFLAELLEEIFCIK